MIITTLLLSAATGQQASPWDEMRKRPHLAIEWSLGHPREDDSPEVADLRRRFLIATNSRLWGTALTLSEPLIELVSDEFSRINVYLHSAEMHLLAGDPESALKIARRHSKPPRDNPTVYDPNRLKAMELEVDALRIKGDVKGALRVREDVEAMHDSTPHVEPPRGWYWADRASQIAPLRAAAAKDPAELLLLAHGGYLPQDLEDYEPAQQKRLVAVFANVTLGHMAYKKGDSAAARSYFTEAKRLIEQRKPIANREMLQWLILREVLDKL